MDHKELRRKIKAFSLDDGHLGNQGYKRVLLQLFGLTGHGKSSFINSCKYILNDGEPFEEYAPTGQSSDGGSITMTRNAYELTPNITIVDNRGCNTITHFERAEVYAQLGNFLPLDQPVEWKEDFKDRMSILVDDDLNKNTTDLLVPIFIYSASYDLQPHVQKDVEVFLKNCEDMTGVAAIIVLTNKNSKDFSELEIKFRLMGMKNVIAIENYTMDSDVKTLGKTTDILRILQMALENVTFRLSLPRDPEKDRRERKKFLLNYIHEAVLEYEKEKIKEDIMRQKMKEERKEPGSKKKCVLL
ncbi:uncharacterized protein [Aquarana catesbeiana]|uniref:uncharacterized protein n=1 Tax=Aquarana catesbeiana TaxID=8400 RepID=UPI003CC9D4E7